MCSTFEYITYDSTADTKQTIAEITAHNEVLLTVYHCTLPSVGADAPMPATKGTPP